MTGMLIGLLIRLAVLFVGWLAAGWLLGFVLVRVWPSMPDKAYTALSRLMAVVFVVLLVIVEVNYLEGLQ